MERQESGALRPGDRLPTSEELAAQLGVSSGTVKNVYRELASEGHMRLRKGIGSFWLGTPEVVKEVEASSRPLRIGISTDTPLDAPAINKGWGGPILGGILKEHLSCLRPLALERVGRIYKDPSEKDRERFNELDGLIVLFLTPHLQPVQDANGRVVPMVSLNPPSVTSTANFVSPDYFACSKALGEIWRKTGRRRVAYVSSNELENSVSSNLRFGGLACGLGVETGRAVELRLYSTDGDGSAVGGAKAIRDALEGGWVPDAVYCGGDLMARGVFNTLRESGFSVPDEVSVVGGSQSEGAMVEPLTNMLHPLEAVGVDLLAMLLRLIDSGSKPQTGIYNPVPFNIGLSTRAVENDLLAAYSRACAKKVDG